MKISRKRFHNIIRKGAAVMLSASMVLSGFTAGGPVYGYADTLTSEISAHPIPSAVIEDYHSYMDDKGYDNYYFNKNRKGRAKELVNYLNTRRDETGLPVLKLEDKEQKLNWNPSQKTIDEGDYQLYLLEWVNGMENMGSGFNLYGRIVYLTDDYKVYYSEQVTLDKQARSFSDLSYGNQFDKGRPNQCTVALPEDCQQILGLMLYKDPGSGDDDDPWNMSSLTLTRVADDSLSNIGPRKKNENGHNYRECLDGYAAARVCDYDMQQAYLGKEAEQEWLYLLETAIIKQNLNGYTTALRVTNGAADLMDKNLQITLDYTDIFGNKRSESFDFNETLVKNFYPELIFTEDFTPHESQVDNYVKDDDNLYYSLVLDQMESIIAGAYHSEGELKSISRPDYDIVAPLPHYVATGKKATGLAGDGTYGDYDFVNKIAMEVLKEDGRDSRDILRHLMDYGNFKDYDWDTADTTQTNLYGAMYFGNFINYDAMERDILGPYTATDLAVDTEHTVGYVDKITISQTKGTGSASLQNVSVYRARKEDFTSSTRMNGGMSTERIFDIENAVLLAEVNAPKGIQLTGNTPAVCQPESSLFTRNDYELIVYKNGSSFSNFAANDYLGIEIDIADVYEAGLETFAAGNADKFNDYTDGLETPHFDDGYDFKDFRKNGGTYSGNYWWIGTGSMYGDSGYIFGAVEFGRSGFKEFLLADPLNSTADIKNYVLEQLTNTYKNYDKGDLISASQAFSIINLMESYYKDPFIVQITYIDESGCRRMVEVPFVTAYMLQIYSDAGIGLSDTDHLIGVLQQGQQTGLRVPLSRFDKIEEINLQFCGTSTSISSFRSNKFFYEPTAAEIADYQQKLGSKGTQQNTFQLLTESNSFKGLTPYAQLGLKENETIRGGAQLPTYDTISVRAVQIYENVTASTFKAEHNGNHIIELVKPSEADYHYEALNYAGTTLTAGSSLHLTTTDESTGRAPTLEKGSASPGEDFYQDLYLIELIGKPLSDSNSAKDLNIQLKYTSAAGEQVTTEVTPISTLSQDYYGTIGNFSKAEETYHTGSAMDSGKIYYTIRLSGVKNFDSIIVQIPDGYIGGWQVDEVNVKELTYLSQRTVSGSDEVKFTDNYVITREHEGNVVAFNNKPVALQTAGASKTFNFTVVNEDGSLTEPGSQTKDDVTDHITSNPTTITYEETLRNLGLATVKYQYDIRVDVADIADAGSSNYFYFQLVFENGTSGVVLANQQLASDSFRQGQSESFSIKTTQNYGELKGIRIICDASSANSQTFDKLNIDSVTVSLANKGGIRSWIIENVGWIDINYRDEGIHNSITATIEDQGFTNEQVVNEFPVTRQATAARLLFNITTSAASSENYIAQDGKFEGVLTYLDTAGYTKTYNFDLISRIEEFNGTADRARMLRPNMSNYFTLMLTDVSSIKSLTIYRSNGSDSWLVNNVVISQISELGDVYLSTDGEFKRYIEDETHLADSANINQDIPASGSGTFTFPQHSIEVNTNTDDPAGWSTTITRIPTTNQDSFNVYLLPGGSYSFSKTTIPNIQGVLDYTFKTGVNLGQEAFIFNDTGEINGTTVLKATGIKITDMNVLKKLHLKYNGNSANAPVISGAKVERVRDNTIIDTYYFDFLSTELASGITNTALAKADTTASNTVQTVVLQPAEGQNFVFTPSSSDVAVSLLYRSENDAEAQTAYFASPYKFLTDAEITLINSAMAVEIPFEVSGVSEVVGIAVIGSGPNVKIENAMVYNYINNNGSESLLNICQIAEGFTVNTSRQTLLADEDSNVSPVTFTFHTSSDDNFAGAGTSGNIPITINYTDTDGLPAEFHISSLSDYLPANTVPEADSKVSFTVMLNNLDTLNSLDISVENDSWHLTKVAAEITTVSEGSNGKDKLVKIQREAFHDNWITISKPAVIEFSSDDDSEIERNELINLSVTGKASLSGNTKTAGSGSSLNLEVYSGDTVSLVPNVTVNGEPDTTVVWDKSKYSSYMTEGKDGKMTFRVPSGSVGTTYTFDAYCKANKDLWVTVALTVVSPGTSETSGGTVSGGGTSTVSESGEPGMVLTVSKAGGGSVANASFGIADNNRIYVVEVPKGTTATYEVQVSTSDSSPVGTKVSIDTISDVVFDSTNNTVSGTTISRTISCSSINDDFMPFEVTVRFQIV